MIIHIFDLIPESRENRGENLKTTVLDHYEKAFPDAHITYFDMTMEPIKNCIGCWDCWVKTPGLCVHKDLMVRHYPHLIMADKTVMLLDSRQGFVSGNTKTFIDRLIPLFHPYIRIVDGEMNHYARYDNQPDFDYYWDNTLWSSTENQLIEDYLYRCNHHFKAEGNRLFWENDSLKSIPLIKRLPKADLPRESLIPPVSDTTKIILYNGSPRGKKSNSLILLEQVILGLKNEGVTDEQIEIRHLYETKNHDQWAATFHRDQRHFFLFPLYVHAMPGIVMHFLEKLTPSPDGKTQMTYFIQSGFLEAFQSFYLRPILAHITKRLNCVYGGVGIKGGMEGIQIKTAQMNQKLFLQFQGLGSAFVQEGKLPENLTETMMQPVHLNLKTQFLYKLLKPTGLIHFYWDMQLKKNGVKEKSFAKPYQISSTSQ